MTYCIRWVAPVATLAMAMIASCSIIDVGQDVEITQGAMRHRGEDINRSTQFALDVKATADARVSETREVSKTEGTASAEQAAIQQTSTFEVFSQATAQAQPISNWVNELYASGILHSVQGNHHTLPDFETSWAQINNYDYLLTEYTSADFLIQATSSWESASQTANLWNSGCGFVFRMNARGDHYLIFPAMDGWVYLYRKLDQDIVKLGRSRYSDVQIAKGNAEITLVAEGEWITFLIDNDIVIQIQDKLLSSGFLGYAVVSGTNKDFGTRCRMTNIDLWKLHTSY